MAKDPRWRYLNSIPVGDRGSDIDHLIIGPAGVFTVNTKHHAKANLWVGGNTFMVNGTRVPYIRNSRHEAQRASRLLSAAVRGHVQAQGLIVPVNANRLTVRRKPDDVLIMNRKGLVRFLRSLPHTLSPEQVDIIYARARLSTTWQ